MDNISLSDLANIASILSFIATLWIGSNVIKIKTNISNKINNNEQNMKNSKNSQQQINTKG